MRAVGRFVGGRASARRGSTTRRAAAGGPVHGTDLRRDASSWRWRPVASTKACDAARDGIERLNRTQRPLLPDRARRDGRPRRGRSCRARVGRAVMPRSANAAATAAAAYAAELEGWVAEIDDPAAFGGLLARRCGDGRRRRRVGLPASRVPAAWRAAVDTADRAGYAWRKAYARYRLGEALLGARAPRRESTVALGEASG